MEKTKNTHSAVRTSITQALFSLMAEKPYDAITVADIARRAQVARISFYRNFDSKDDVLARNAQRITEEFLATLPPHLREYDSAAYITAILENTRAHDEDIRILIAANKMDIVREEFDRAFAVGGKDKRDSARRRFLSGGLYNLFYKWALEGYDPPAERIAHFVCGIFQQAERSDG